MAEFVMPSLGADMDAGTLVEWLKHPGDAIKRGDIIAVVETQKGAIEIEAFEEGTLDRPLVEVGTRVPVGTPLAFIRTAGAPAPSPVPSEIQVPVAPTRAALAAAPTIVPPSTIGVRVSPAARRIAAERSISLEGLKGTGPGGAIISSDVEPAARAVQAPAVKRPGIDLGAVKGSSQGSPTLRRRRKSVAQSSRSRCRSACRSAMASAAWSKVQPTSDRSSEKDQRQTGH